MYDFLAVAYLLRPELFKITNSKIVVSTKGKTRGKTKLHKNGYSCSLAVKANKKGIIELGLDTILGQD